MKVTLIAFIIFFCCFGSNLIAQGTAASDKPDTTKQLSEIANQVHAVWTPVVIESIERGNCAEKDHAGIGDNIIVRLSRKLDSGQSAQMLYINGIPMHGINATGGDSVLLFQLTRTTDESDSSWSELYCGVCSDTLNTNVAIGNGNSIISTARNFKIVLIHHSGSHWGFWFIVLLVIGFFIIAKKTDLLRETNGPFAPDLSLPKRKQRRVYSLARVQLAFWTMMISCGYIFIWLATGAPPRVFDSTLALMGITIAATAGARIIDVSQAKSSDNTVPVPNTDNWLQDIISDNNGVNLHRFQMIVWTLIFGILFFLHIVHCYSFLDLTTTQLVLLGIGSATYVGLKLSEDAPPSADTGSEIKRR